MSLANDNAYTDVEPTVIDWFKEQTLTTQDAQRYLVSLFPFARWVPRYNLRWLLGDIIAGITVGSVVIPQGMAYASLAELPPQFGLYSSFMGVLVYWLFGTSKDITIGPVAVMSTVTGNVVLRVKETDPDLPGYVVASAMAVLAGGIILFVGLIRYGWIVEFISLAAIASFMTGSAVNIAVGQIPTLMGIGGFSTRDATYQVVINILKHLGRTSRHDAAMGISALVLLYLIRLILYLAARKWPLRRKLFNLIATTRVVFVILLYVMISWLATRDRKSNPEFKILGTVPHGFQNVGVPKITVPIIRTFASQLPATVLILWIEHIAIAKAFGRVNHYTINNSQEMVAIGLTNLLGPFLGAYPTTGSFSRTAINSKAGVCSPVGGLFSAALVLLGIYALPAVFFYIPQASLAAVIIHAVCDLITTPDTLYQFWKVSPFEVVIFLTGVLVTVFSTIEIGLYTTICISLVQLLFRFAKAQGVILGKVKVHAVLGNRLLPEHGEIRAATKFSDTANPNLSARNVFLPINHQDGSNPEIQVEAPYPGIFIYRFSDGFNYPNANRYLDHLLKIVYQSSRPGKLAELATGKDRTWSDLQIPRPISSSSHQSLPQLESIILDFSAVSFVDTTAIQSLIDTRNTLDRWAAPETPEWHIASINNKWTRRALVHAGFGYPTPDSPHYHRWKPVFSVADIGGGNSAATAAQLSEIENARRRAQEQQQQQQQQKRSSLSKTSSSSSGKGSITGTGSKPSGGAHVRLSSVDEDRAVAVPEEAHNIRVKTQTTVAYQDVRTLPPPLAALQQTVPQVRDLGFPLPPGGSSQTQLPTTSTESNTLASDLESQLRSSTAYNAFAAARPPKVTLVNGLDKPLFHVVEGVSRPLFHVGLSSALQSAVHNIELKKELKKMEGTRSDDSGGEAAWV